MSNDRNNARGPVQWPAALTREFDSLGWLPHVLAANVLKFIRGGNYEAAHHFFVELTELAHRTNSYEKPAPFMVMQQLVKHLTDAEFESLARGGRW